MQRLFLTGPLVFAILVVVSATGCTQQTSGADEVVTMRKACAKTACDSINESRDKYCAHCRAECATLDGCSASEICTVCTHEPCSADLEQRCDEEKWTADLPAMPTPGLTQACIDLFDSDVSRCGRTVSDEDIADAVSRCRRRARAMTAAVVPALRCYATLPCDTNDVGTVQACDVKPSHFGDEVCAAIAARCADDANEDLRDELNRLGAILKPAMLDAARQCVAQSSCADVTGCMEAWRKLLD